MRVPFVKEFADPRRWKELPANSVLFIDEAQQVWRTRTAGRAVPQEIVDLEVHRHQGIDIYLITQSPMYLDSHIRPLISSHEHLISYDKKTARIFRFTECYEDVKSSQLRSRAQFTVWNYPTQHYADYEFAEVHTAKAKRPWKHRIIKPLFVFCGLGGAYLIYSLIWGNSVSPDDAPAPAPKVSAQVSQPSLFGGIGAGVVAAQPKFRDNVDALAPV